MCIHVSVTAMSSLCDFPQILLTLHQQHLLGHLGSKQETAAAGWAAAAFTGGFTETCRPRPINSSTQAQRQVVQWLARMPLGMHADEVILESAMAPGKRSQCAGTSAELWVSRKPLDALHLGLQRRKHACKLPAQHRLEALNFI